MNLKNKRSEKKIRKNRGVRLRRLFFTTVLFIGLFISTGFQCFAFCGGDFDKDIDVDGSDFSVFAADFGRSDCEQGEVCEGDFDDNGNVDDSDLSVFAADFGRTDCPGPKIIILSPVENTVVTTSLTPIPAAVDVAIQVSVSDVPSNWGVEFVFDGNDLQSDKITPVPSEFIKSLVPGEHSVVAYIIDELQDRKAAFSDQVTFGVGDYYVAFGDSITFGFWHDFVSEDDTSADGRNSGGGYPPILNDLLTGAKGYSHSVENESVSGDESIDGANRIAGVLAAHPNANYFLILFGTNDSFIPIPSGVGLSPTDSGYPGTYKDNMQQIVDAIVQAGKTPFLAKVPIQYGQCTGPESCIPFPNPSTAPENIFISMQYNVVIDELIRDNGIEVAPGTLLDPPDFYSYFEATPLDGEGKSVEFDDFLHPDGIGFQSMANLWLQALTP